MSLQIGIGTQMVVVLIGVTVGSLAALGGRFSDNFLMRIVDITYAFPDLLFIVDNEDDSFSSRHLPLSLPKAILI